MQRHDTLSTCMLRKKHSSSTKEWEFNSVVPEVAKKQAAALQAATYLEAEPRLEVGMEDQGIYWVQSASAGSCATGGQVTAGVSFGWRVDLRAYKTHQWGEICGCGVPASSSGDTCRCALPFTLSNSFVLPFASFLSAHNHILTQPYSLCRHTRKLLAHKSLPACEYVKPWSTPQAWERQVGQTVAPIRADEVVSVRVFVLHYDLELNNPCCRLTPPLYSLPWQAVLELKSQKKMITFEQPTINVGSVGKPPSKLSGREARRIKDVLTHVMEGKDAAKSVVKDVLMGGNKTKRGSIPGQLQVCGACGVRGCRASNKDCPGRGHEAQKRVCADSTEVTEMGFLHSEGRVVLKNVVAASQVFASGTISGIFGPNGWGNTPHGPQQVSLVLCDAG